MNLVKLRFNSSKSPDQSFSHIILNSPLISLVFVENSEPFILSPVDSLTSSILLPSIAGNLSYLTGKFNLSS